MNGQVHPLPTTTACLNDSRKLFSLLTFLIPSTVHFHHMSLRHINSTKSTKLKVCPHSPCQTLVLVS
jgi:hypothetical protein